MIALLEAKRAGLLARRYWPANIVAGLIVAVVALPLAMAFAIASGAKPEQGIYTAIVAGGLAAVFGGSRLQISGPTGAFIVILAGVSARYGIVGLQMATLMAGFMLLGMAFTRMGGVIKFIPDPVVIGFTSGIAVIIFVSQWKEFLGLDVMLGVEYFHEKIMILIGAVPDTHLATALLGGFSLLVLIFTPRFSKRVPAPLIVIILATIVQAVFQFEGVATIGTAFGGIPQELPTMQWPQVSFSDMLHLIGPAFAIALLCAIESLLSAVVADSMTGTKHDSNQELLGQGIANIFSPLFGGFAATGAIARTAINIRQGGNSPIAGIVHAFVLLIIVLLMAPLAEHIPLSALAAILFMVAYNMSEMRRFKYILTTASRGDVAVLLTTFLLTVFSDLVIAVNIGVVIAALLFMKRMAEAVVLTEQTADQLRLPAQEKRGFILPERTVVFALEGPFFFGAAERLEETLEHVHNHADILVLRLEQVPFIDTTGVQAFWSLLHVCDRHHTRLVLCAVRPNVLKKLARAGFLDRLGATNVIACLAALEQ